MINIADSENDANENENDELISLGMKFAKYQFADCSFFSEENVEKLDREELERVCLSLGLRLRCHLPRD